MILQIEETPDDLYWMKKPVVEDLLVKPVMMVGPTRPISIQTNTQLPTIMTGNVQSNPNQKLIINKNSCVKCGATFVLKSQLDKHLLLHSPTSQICSICRKTFANVYRLQRHMISHDESTDLRKFKCTECGKAFKFKHHLKEHVRIHSGEKPFECQNCGKRFSHSGSYSSHMTSKKCWVMGVRMNSGAGASSAGIGIIPDSKQSYASAVGAEKYSEVDIIPTAAELTLHTLYASQLQQQAVAAAMLQYETASSAANRVQTHQYLAQLAATAPRSAFLPNQIGQMLNAYSQIPGAFSKDVTQQGLLKVGEKTDENQNEKHRKSPSCTTPATTLVIPKVERSSEEMNYRLKLSCMFCDMTFFSAVDHHQHERYLCEKREDKGRSTITKTENFECEEHEDSTPTFSGSMSCRYCSTTFDGPVELHQHERYLCHKNSDISPVTIKPSRENSPGEALNTPLTVNKFNKSPKIVPVAHSASAMSTSEDDIDDQFVDKDGQQYRVRSMITDQQLAILKAKYSLNPRPSSHELMDIGSQIGFPKRVVQVWFQNMRARDRRRGKVIIPGYKGPGSVSSATSSPEKSGTVGIFAGEFAAVPNIGYASTAGIGVYYAAAQHIGASPLYASTPTSGTMQVEPLDLSFKSKTKIELASSKPYTPQLGTFDDEVLNLSMKNSPNISVQSTSDTEIKIELSTAPLSPITCVTNPQHASSLVPGPLYASTPSAPSPHSTMPAITSPSSSEITGSTSLECSFNSAISMDSAGMESGACSLINLAKRARQQMEGEGYYSGDGGDSLMIDESGTDSPVSDSAIHSSTARKRSRKSWKQHRIISISHSPLHGEAGLYSCDQCDKLFSKQSSLARHKYEHSGQRPFSCNICTKSFKHKHHLTEHKRLHSGEKPFCCKKCGKRFSHSGSFSQHMNHRFKFCKQAKASCQVEEEV